MKKGNVQDKDQPFAGGQIGQMEMKGVNCWVLVLLSFFSFVIFSIQRLTGFTIFCLLITAIGCPFNFGWNSGLYNTPATVNEQDLISITFLYFLFYFTNFEVIRNFYNSIRKFYNNNFILFYKYIHYKSYSSYIFL